MMSYLARNIKKSVFFAGALLTLSFPPVNFLPAAFIGFSLLFYGLYNARDNLRQIFLLGWLFGIGQFFFGLYWIGSSLIVEAEDFLWLLPFAVTLIPAGLGLYLAVAAWSWGKFIKMFRIENILAQALAMAAFYGLFEYARALFFTGFPWNMPAMIWAGFLPLAQIIAPIGLYAMNVVVLISLFACAACFISPQKKLSLFIGLFPLGVTFIYGSFILRAPDISAQTDATHIAIIQPNIPQTEKWKRENRAQITETLFALSRDALSENPDIIIWPEVALPFYIDESENFSRLLQKNLPPKTLLITGAIRREKTAQNKYKHYNSIMVWNGAGDLLTYSDKVHLVPFGEYLPLQNFLERIGLRQLTQLRGGFTAGAPAPLLSTPAMPTAVPLICYEAIFPLKDYTSPLKAYWLLNVTNDGWFGKTVGPHQHLAHARLRAIETNLPFIRSANTGISAAFDKKGRLVSSVELEKRGIIHVTIHESEKYHHFLRPAGLIFTCIAVLLFVILFIIVFRENYKIAKSV